MKRFIRFMLVSCKRTTELIEKKSVDALSLKETLELNFHKSMCITCRSYYKSSAEIDEGLSELFDKSENQTPASLSESKKSAILQEIRKDKNK